MKELPSGYEPYRLFEYRNRKVEVVVRPEDARGWQMYADENDPFGVWTVLITLKDNSIRVKLDEPSARELVRSLAQFVAEDAARGVRNSMLFRKRGSD